MGSGAWGSGLGFLVRPDVRYFSREMGFDTHGTTRITFGHNLS